MRIILAVAFIVATAAFAGCLDNNASAGTLSPEATLTSNGHPAFGYPTTADLSEVPVDGLPADWTLTPKRELPTDINALETVKELAGPESGSGLAVFGHYAYAGAWNREYFAVVDVSDPANPVVVGETAAKTGDIEIIAYPDGRLVAVTATRGATIEVIDVTEPTDPHVIYTIETTQGNHNLAVVPGTPLLYNAGSAVDIWDLSDPEDPVLAGVFEEGGENGRCHDIEFFVDNERGLYRGYCAGYGNTEIWDITDPTDPSVVIKIPYPSMEQGLPVVGDDDYLPDLGQPGAGFSHLAIVNHDASVLIVGDETGGGAAPGCDATVAGESGPNGNIWFYDISDETAPVLKSHLSANQFEAFGSCTAHFGRTIEDTNHIAVAYYTAGVLLVDFNDLENPVIEDVWNARGPTDACTLCASWDAVYHQGYIFVGDIDRGMDILTLA